MIDRENVINCLTDIEQIMITRQEICPREELQYWVELQEGVANALAMLKEQEAVPPIPYHRSDGTIFKYECRKCRTKIFKGDLFCRHCGNPVLWGGR